ncbi:hypothetical protein [Ensifer canadensis]
MSDAPKEPEQFTLKVPRFEVSGTGERSSRHAAKLAYLAIAKMTLVPIVALVISKAFELW